MKITINRILTLAIVAGHMSEAPVKLPNSLFVTSLLELLSQHGQRDGIFYSSTKKAYFPGKPESRNNSLMEPNPSPKQIPETSPRDLFAPDSGALIYDPGSNLPRGHTLHFDKRELL